MPKIKLQGNFYYKSLNFTCIISFTPQKIFLKEALILITITLIDYVKLFSLYLDIFSIFKSWSNLWLLPLPYLFTSYQSQILLIFLPKNSPNSFNFSLSPLSPLISNEYSHTWTPWQPCNWYIIAYRHFSYSF